MIRPATVIAVLLLSISVYGLFQVKYKVQDLRKDLGEMHRQIDQEEDAIHVLRAEWAYLNQPDRLRSLAEGHLNMAAISSAQMGDINQDKQLKLAVYSSPEEGGGASGGNVAKADKPEETGKSAKPSFLALDKHTDEPSAVNSRVSAGKKAIAYMKEKPVSVPGVMAKGKAVTVAKAAAKPAVRQLRKEMVASVSTTTVNGFASAVKQAALQGGGVSKSPRQIAANTAHKDKLPAGKNARSLASAKPKSARNGDAKMASANDGTRRPATTHYLTMKPILSSLRE